MKKDKLVKRDKKEILKKDLKKISGGVGVVADEDAELVAPKGKILPKGKIVR